MIDCIIHELIIDLCKNSSPDVGLMMFSSNIEMMDEVKKRCIGLLTQESIEVYIYT